MDQKWMKILVILVFYQEINTGSCEMKVIKEKQPVDIKCNLQGFGASFIWFRVLDKPGVEFIASYGLNGMLKENPSLSSIFSHTKSSSAILRLNSFDRARDTGAYVCAFFRTPGPQFGEVTRLVGETIKVTTKAPMKTTPTPTTTATPCVCDSDTQPGQTNPSMLCPLIILGPLAGGCGLLLLLLIITTVYCNKIRTRRCPHHYKRKPREVPPVKQVLTNRRM